LKKIYNEAEKGEQASMIHMFGIRYALEIKESGAAKKDIAIEAEIGESYGTEINKGVKLSKYVQIKDEYKNRF
jgi:5-methylcytosine-specific restriction protein B